MELSRAVAIAREALAGGVRARPGDLIIGDDNSVIVVPAERAYEVALRTLEMKNRG